MADAASVHQEATERATQVRQELGLPPDRPVPDIIPLMEQLGLTVFVEPFGRRGPWGAYLPLAKANVVFLNGSLPLPWLRTTAAHELGHWAFTDGAQLDRLSDVKVDGASTAGNKTSSGLERRANAFARCFLMPEPAIVAHLEKVPEHPAISVSNLNRLAERFGTTAVQVGRHLETLGRMDGNARRGLIARPEAISLERQEIEETRRVPTDYLERAFRAYRRSRISFARLAELLRLNDQAEIDDLRALLKEYGALHPDDATDGTLALEELPVLAEQRA